MQMFIFMDRIVLTNILVRRRYVMYQSQHASLQVDDKTIDSEREYLWMCDSMEKHIV